MCKQFPRLTDEMLPPSYFYGASADVVAELVPDTRRFPLEFLLAKALFICRSW